MKTQAKPVFKGNRARFTVLVPTADYEALRDAPGNLTWRQLAQVAIREYAAKLKAEAPTEESPMGA